MVAVLSNGQEISYALYEKRKEEASLEIPQLQSTLSIFPDFEEEFAPKTNETSNEVSEILLEIAENFKKLATALKSK